MEDISLSIIIVNWNTRDVTRACLQSVQEHVTGVSYEVIVVDNASSDDSVAMMRQEFPQFQVIANTENAGFGRANNQAMRIARGRYFLLLNSDTLIFDDAIQRLLRYVADDPAIGMAGCKLLFEDRSLQHSCYRFPSLRLAVLEELLLYKLLPRQRQGEILLNGYWDYSHARDVDWIMGAAMLLRREIFEQTGGFDESIFMYGEEMEWCMRVRARGWRIAYTPECAIVHLNHKSSDKKFGDDRRVALSYNRLYETYAHLSGPVAARALLVLKTIGALIRLCYFGLQTSRAAAKAAPQEYFRSQRRAARQVLRYHLRAMVGRAHGEGRAAAEGRA
jgi:GT2 family glycosyltransferase